MSLSGVITTTQQKVTGTIRGTLDPNSTGKVAPYGFIYENTVNGDAYIKQGSGSLNWNKIIAGYGIETTLTGGSGNLATANAIKVYADSLIPELNALVYKGVIDCSSNPNYPAANCGWVYEISVAGKIGGVSGKVVEVKDIILCNQDNTPTGDESLVGAYWDAIQTNIDGAVTGPASSTINGIPSFSTVLGKTIQDSGYIAQDASISQKGFIQLSNLYSGTSQLLATTEKALSDGLNTKENSFSKGSVLAGSSKLSVLNGTSVLHTNNTTVDVIEKNIIHQNLSGRGTHTHGQIDTHIDGTSDFHSALVITSTPSGSLNSASVQNALYELALETDRIPNSSAGVWTSPTVTGGSGTITIGSGEYLLYSSSAYDETTLTKYTIAGGTFSVPADSTIHYIVADYNNGVPITKIISDVTTINQANIVPILTVYNLLSTVLYLFWDNMAKGLANKLSHRFVKTERFKIQPGGLVLNEQATRLINITGGYVWFGGCYTTLQTVNSGVSGEYIAFYYHVGGVWTRTTGTQYNNTQYDDGTNLQTLLPNKYTVNWVYRGFSEDPINIVNRPVVVLGMGNYTLAEAISSNPPPNLPPVMSNFTMLVGRIIVKKDSNTSAQIDTLESDNLGFSSITIHNGLSELQGGTIDQYYHLTESEHIVTTQVSSSTLSGILTPTDWNTFNNKQDIINSGNLTGTENQITVSNGTGVVIGAGTLLSLPQDIATISEPIFNRVTLTATPFSDTDASTKKYVDDMFPVQETNLFFNDVSTLNSSSTKHGFLPRLSDNNNQFLNGQGNWTTPSGTASNSYSLTSFTGQTSVNVLHNFGTYPIVQVFLDTGAVEIPYSITHNTVYDFTVLFTTSTNGSIIASVGSPQPQSLSTITNDYSILTSDRILYVTSADKLLTLPTAIGNSGREYVIDNASPGDIFLSGSLGQLIENENLQTIPPSSAINIYSNGSTWRIY
jgi:hypothetical protein